MAVSSTGFLYKPAGENSGRPVVITPPKYRGQIQSVHLVDSSGNVTGQGNFRHDYTGNDPGRGGGIWDLPHGNGSQVRVTLDSGEVVNFAGGGSGRNDGTQSVDGGAGGDGTGTTTDETNDNPLQPPNLTSLFPEFKPVKFPTIKTAPFKFTDPQQFAKGFADFNRGELNKNFDQGGQFALKALDTELKGLKGFAPAAAALSREQTSIDNRVNQEARTSQIDSVLPNARGDLAAQRGRALTYASGKLPFADRALELGIRSRAADSSNFSGFGAESSQAVKTSDLMSAEERFKVAQYGEGLQAQNLSQDAELSLAPLEYNQLGSQIRPTPEVGAGRFQYQGAGMVNEATLIPPTAALSANIQQEQFGTQIEQRTREFNAAGTFNASTFNSAGAFTAGLGLFNYQVGLANQIIAANAGQIATANGVNAAGINATNYNAGQQDAQAGQTISSVLQGIGALPGAIGAISSVLGSGASAPATSAPDLSTSNTTLESPSISARTASPQLLEPDAATPSSYKFPAGANVPSGYTPIGSNPDGSTSVVDNGGYQSEIEKMANVSGVATSSLDVGNAAIADKALSSAASLSYVPIQGFQQIALTGGGRPVYSLPAAAASDNAGAGADNVSNLGVMLGALGVADPEAYGTLGNIADSSSDPAILAAYNDAYLSGGPGAVSEAILNRLGDKGRGDLSTPEGQQVAFGAQRIGELWPGLSPMQRSMAISSLVKPALKNATGRDVSQDAVPGSHRSVAGPLKIADVVGVTSNGLNGVALARNWNQLSAISDIVGNSSHPGPIARIMDHIGMLGYGPQGSAVPVNPKELKGAEAAPEFGVGALHFTGSSVPRGYTKIARSEFGGVIAVPENLAHTSPYAGKRYKVSGDLAAKVAEGKHPAQKNWKPAPNGKLIRGSSGGSAIVSSMNILRQANPSLHGAIAAHSFFNDVLGA